MNVEHKAKLLIQELLAESSSGLTIVAISTQGETIEVNGSPTDGNYIYTPGYNGGDSNSSHIIINSASPLQEFDDFDGDASEYPVVAQISAAMEASGFEGLDGFCAGSLKKNPASSAKG
jgi:hypothetical protein